MSNETDRELLELAAKAAGYQPDGRFGRGLMVVINAGQEDQTAFAFDPLNDDGDALRLAVKLKLYGDHVVAWWHDYFGTGQIPYGADPCAATRRAIVRAAAEIGRAMK